MSTLITKAHLWRFGVVLIVMVGACTDGFVTPWPKGLEWDTLSPNIVQWNGSRWDSLGAGLDSVVNVVEFAPNGDLYAGGRFQHSGTRRVRHVARWSARDGTWNSVGNGVNGEVFAIAFVGGNVIVGGLFSEAYNPDSSVVHASNVALWDGQRWHAFTRTFHDVVHELLVARDALYIGTRYGLYRADFQSRTVEHIAQFQNGAMALALYNDSLFIGGWFDAVRHIPASPVTIHNLRDSSWSQSDYLDTAGFVSDENIVRDLAVHGSMLFLGGTFGLGRHRSIAAIDLRTGKEVYIPGIVQGVQLGLTIGVYTIEVTEPYVYAGGFFFRTYEGERELIGVGRYNRSTARWEPMGRGLTGTVYDLAVRGSAVVCGGGIVGSVR
jgi:hypothetical protein